MEAAPPTPGASSAFGAAPPPKPPRTQRGLRVDEYTRAQSGVWYYQVDIELRYVHAPNAALHDGRLDACGEDDVQCYAVRRRYNEFAQLYDKIKDEIVAAAPAAPHAVGDSGLPPFPQKELISSAVLGMLWRGSSPTSVLEDRRAKFEALLRWIEGHPVLRESQAYIDFLGQPPQVSEGYVSLKEYSSQNWLSSLEKVTKEKAKRRRRLSSDCSNYFGALAAADAAPRRPRKRRAAHRTEPPHAPAKRARRPLAAPTRAAPAAAPRQKTRARPRSSSSTLGDTPQRPLILLCGDGDPAAQVESSHSHKRKKVQ